MRDSYLQFCDGLASAARLVVKVVMTIMTVDVLLGVFCRYVLHDALSWTEEVARYLMVWMGFLAIGLALREGNHVAVEFLVDKVSAGPRRVVFVIIRLLSLFFLLSVIGAGAVLVFRVRSQSTPVLGISMMWPYLAVPLGCLLTALEMLALMLRDPEGRQAHLDRDDVVAPESVG